MKPRWMPFFVLVVLVAVGVVRADGPYVVGDRLDEIALEDQHGVARKIDASTRQFVFTADMDAGDNVKSALAEDGAKLLAARPTSYVADISEMPALVRRLFAMPGLRKREYSMVLDTEGEATRRIPRRAGRATLVRLDELEIVELRYLATVDEVREALGAESADDRR